MALCLGQVIGCANRPGLTRQAAPLLGNEVTPANLLTQCLNVVDSPEIVGAADPLLVHHSIIYQALHRYDCQP
jgi:hypothetical protein